MDKGRRPGPLPLPEGRRKGLSIPAVGGLSALWQRLGHVFTKAKSSSVGHLLYEFQTENIQSKDQATHDILQVILFSIYCSAPRKALSNFLFPKTHGLQLCALPGKSNLNARDPRGRWGPRCLWAAGTAEQLPADTPSFRCGAPLFVSLLTALLMPHLSSALKQSFRDAFGNLSLCGLSGLVSICREGEFACLGRREKWALQKSRDAWFPGGVSGNPDPHRTPLFPREAPSGTEGEILLNL